MADLTAADFWEVGASGASYSREHVLDVLERRAQDGSGDSWEASSFECRLLAPDVYLLSYLLVQHERVTRRTTIWDRHGARWQARFHQGTPVAG